MYIYESAVDVQEQETGSGFSGGGRIFGRLKSHLILTQDGSFLGGSGQIGGVPSSANLKGAAVWCHLMSQFSEDPGGFGAAPAGAAAGTRQELRTDARGPVRD